MTHIPTVPRDQLSALEPILKGMETSMGFVPTSTLTMAALAEHFTPRQIVEIVAVIALFGFLNRWNDTLATTLEDEPKAFATAELADHGWAAGKHG